MNTWLKPTRLQGLHVQISCIILFIMCLIPLYYVMRSYASQSWCSLINWNLLFFVFSNFCEPKDEQMTRNYNHETGPDFDVCRWMSPTLQFQFRLAWVCAKCYKKCRCRNLKPTPNSLSGRLLNITTIPTGASPNFVWMTGHSTLSQRNSALLQRNLRKTTTLSTIPHRSQSGDTLDNYQSFPCRFEN